MHSAVEYGGISAVCTEIIPILTPSTSRRDSTLFGFNPWRNQDRSLWKAAVDVPCRLLRVALFVLRVSFFGYA